MLKKVFLKGMQFVMGAMPVILTGLLFINSNSTACVVNGQPEPPKSLKNYRKF